MSARRFALFAALALFVMFVAGNLLANSWFKTWRLDLTENHLYSLSEGTVHTLDSLSEPIELTLYYSRDGAAASPQVQTYGARVREMLQTFAARSHGRVRFVEVNVKPFSEEEDQAQQAGVQPVRLNEGGDPFYFGLVGANGIDDKRAIPMFDPQREPFLEYEVTRLIYELENPDKTRVALITSLPIDPAAAAGSMAAPGSQSLFAAELGRMMDVTKLPPDFTDIPDVDVLAIIHPAPLTPAQAFAIDQFIMRKGRAFIALDPASLMADQAGGGFDPSNPTQALTASNLDPLLPHWGVQMTREVVLDLQGALPVQTQDANGQPGQAPQPLFFRIPAAQLDRSDLMTAWLQRDINFGLAGGLSWSERPGAEVHPLARTSGQTMRIPSALAMTRPQPDQLLRDWQPAGRIETVALRLSGNLESTFAGGLPPGIVLAPGARVLTRSATPAQLVVVADADFLADDFYVGQGGTPAADNASFALNAIDVLGGSDALVSLRSRAPSVRRMELVERMEADAQRRIQRRQEDLQGELTETEQQLQELQARGRGSGFFSGDLGAELTPEERAAIDRFQARVTQVRTELRGVERNLRSDIDQLKALVIFINVWLAPMLVAGAGLFLFWRRQRRTKGKSASPPTAQTGARS